MINKILKILWIIFLFTFPFSLNFVFFEVNSYRFGNFNPWVTGFLYIPEVLLGIILILWLIGKYPYKDFKIKFKWTHLLIFLFLLNIGWITYLKGDITLFGFFLVRIAEILIIYLLFKDKILPVKSVIRVLLYSALFQIIIGYLQTRLNHSLGLTFLGEPMIGPTILNVAKENLAEGIKQIRPYGTFLHPNILGAYLMTILFISMPYLRRGKLIFWLVILTTGIYMTGSQAAQLTTLIGFGLIIAFIFIKEVKYLKWIFYGVLGILFLGNAWLFQNSGQMTVNNSSLQERFDQNVISHNMLTENPWGVGIRNFTLEMEEYSSNKLSPWEFQPVHNVYFLVMNEIGVQGLIILLFLIGMAFYRFWKNGKDSSTIKIGRIVPFLALLIIASFDHLLWDSWVGFILIGISLSKINE